MPKIIPGLKEAILHRAGELIDLGEYDKFSVRSIARDCEIAVGTLYNYFSSKDELLKAVIDTHWQAMLDEVDKKCGEATTITDGVCYICEGIRSFAEKHTEFWISSIMGGFTQSTGTEWKRSLRPAVMERFSALSTRLGYDLDATLLPAIAEILIALGSQCELDINVAIKLLRQATGKLESIKSKMIP